MSLAMTAAFIAITALPPTVTYLIGIILAHRDRRKYKNDTEIIRADFRSDMTTPPQDLQVRPL